MYDEGAGRMTSSPRLCGSLFLSLIMLSHSLLKLAVRVLAGILALQTPPSFCHNGMLWTKLTNTLALSKDHPRNTKTGALCVILTEDGHFSPSGLPCTTTVAGFLDLPSSLDWGRNGGGGGGGGGNDSGGTVLAGLHPFF